MSVYFLFILTLLWLGSSLETCEISGLPSVGGKTWHMQSPVHSSEISVSNDGYLYNLASDLEFPRSIKELVSSSPVLLKDYPETTLIGHKSVVLFRINPRTGAYTEESIPEHLCPIANSVSDLILIARLDYTLTAISSDTQDFLWNATYSEHLEITDKEENEAAEVVQISPNYYFVLFYLSIALAIGFYLGKKRRKDLDECCDISSFPKNNSEEYPQDLVELIDKTEQLSPINSSSKLDLVPYNNEFASFKDTGSPFETEGIQDIVPYNDNGMNLQILEKFKESRHSQSKITFRKQRDYYIKEEEHRIITTFLRDPTVDDYLQRKEVNMPLVLSFNSKPMILSESFAELFEVLNDGNYNRQFVFLRLLGRGAFGCVELAKHKLEGELYAIKKVRMKILADQQINTHKFFKEVKALMQLQSKYIVRYSTSWVESASELPSQINTSSFLSSSEVSEVSNDGIGMEVVLHIQMEFCEGMTLKDYLLTNKYINSSDNFRIFTQILKGVRCIHQKGIIHRDLKPANIFLDSEGNSKIGDFNLATSDNESGMNLNLSNVGTPLYLAPEQEKTKRYTSKADIYSLGIILVEMFNSFDTDHERLHSLRNIRKVGKFPEGFESEFPLQYELAKWITHEDPDLRPDASEILSSELLSTWGQSVLG